MLQRIVRRIQQNLNDPIRRLYWSVIALGLIIVLSTIGYMWIEEMSLLDAMYMTVITIAAVGYQEVIALSPLGRVFTMVVILLGLTATTVILTNAIGLILGALFWRTVRRRRMERVRMNLENHYIVCGYGRMGRQVVNDLRNRNELFLVIESNPELEDEFLQNRIPFVLGDATTDETLEAAGIHQARAIVAALSDDAENIMTVLSARGLNPNLFIVARNVRQESESKLYRAGANRVLNPYQIGGHRIALSVLRPAVHDFLNHIFHFGDEGPDVDIGQMEIDESSSLIGETIAASNLRDTYGVNVLGIRLANGELMLTPPPQTKLEANMTLIVIGASKDIYHLEQKPSA